MICCRNEQRSSTCENIIVKEIIVALVPNSSIPNEVFKVEWFASAAWIKIFQ